MSSEVPRTVLGDVAEIVMGQSPPGDTYNEAGTGVPLVNGPAQFGERTPLATKWTTAPTKLSLPGDVVFCVRGSTTGRMVRADGEYCLGRGVASIRGETVRDSNFIHYALQSGLARLLQQATGSTFPNLSSRSLSCFDLPWPETPIRHGIAEVLGALDDRVELLTDMARTCDEIRQSLFDGWILDNPDRPSWATVPLGSVCTTQYGFTASASSEQVGPHFLRVTDINKRPWVDWDQTPYAEVPADQVSKYRLLPGDILVARMADPGKSALIDAEVDAVFASYLVRLKSETSEMAQFIYGFLQSREYENYADGAQYGSVQRNMNARVIVGCDVPMPPATVVHRYAESAASLRRRMAAAIEEAQLIKSIRDTLLPRLLSGELRVEDPGRLLGDVA